MGQSLSSVLNALRWDLKCFDLWETPHPSPFAYFFFTFASSLHPWLGWESHCTECYTNTSCCHPTPEWCWKYCWEPHKKLILLLKAACGRKPWVKLQIQALQHNLRNGSHFSPSSKFCLPPVPWFQPLAACRGSGKCRSVFKSGFLTRNHTVWGDVH